MLNSALVTDVNTRPIDRKLKSQPYRSTQGKQSVLMIKDKQTIFSLMEKGKKGTNVALKFKSGKQKNSYIRNNREKILKFDESVEMSEGLKKHVRTGNTCSLYINSSKS